IGITRFYYPVGHGIVAKVNATMGVINSPEGPSGVGVSERFFEGGINSLRGFNFRSVSPTQPNPSSSAPNGPLQDVAVGGTKELMSNWEVEFPILDEAGLRGVVFFDAGNVYSQTQRLFDPTAPGKLGLLMSVGVGARWFTPLGPL